MIPHSRPTLGPEEKSVVAQVLDSGQIAQGRKTIEFEKKFCAFTGRRYAVAVSSGTSALHLALVALGISRGDEVLLPSYTCAALLHAVDHVGARPVLADIDLEDFNLSVTDVRKKVRRRTKAVIVPHAFGRAARMEEILNLKIPVIEDGTQALGARVGRKRVGSFGVLSLFSFYATKMITTGEGGMVLTDSPRLAERIHDLRDYDKKENFKFRTNSKMTDVEAAMGIEQLKKLPSFIRRRRQIASGYQESLRGSGLFLPAEDSDRSHVYYRYVVRIPRGFKEWARRLFAQGIDAKSPVFKPLHPYLNLSDSSFPATVQAMKESLSLPIYPSLTDEECNQIYRALQGNSPVLQRKEALSVSV